MIHHPREFERDLNMEADVVVIGAGPGGAVAAHKLTLSGRKVILLEMGGHFGPNDFKRDGLLALKNLYQNAGQIFGQGNAFFTSMFGKGLGGGSLVNSGISFRPPDSAIERWAQEAKLKEFTPSKLKVFTDEVLQILPIEVKEIGKLGRNNTIFKEGVDTLKYKGGVVPRNAPGCQGCAVCYLGCPSGAKQSVDKNFVSSAVEKGLEVYTYAKVLGFEMDEAGKSIRSVSAELLDPETQHKKVGMKLTAKHFVLCSGAIGSPRVLKKSNIANSSGQIGKNFRCHPTTAAIAQFAEAINMSRHVLQGYYCDEFQSEDVLVETVGAPLGIVAPNIPYLGAEHVKVMKNWKHFAMAGAMIRDESSGEVMYQGDGVQIKYEIIEADLIKLTKGMFRSAEILMAAGAHTVFIQNPIQSTFHSLQELREFFRVNTNLGVDIVRSANHGLGTCRMGENPLNSVVDSFGRSHDVGNLWILDSSSFPSALGVNPQITIMTIARRGATFLDGNF